MEVSVDPDGHGPKPFSNSDELKLLRADLEAGLRHLAERFDELGEQLPLLEETGWRCRHPYFGALDISEWMRFMDVHHRHHLKIVRDIRKAAGS